MSFFSIKPSGTVWDWVDYVGYMEIGLGCGGGGNGARGFGGFGGFEDWGVRGFNDAGFLLWFYLLVNLQGMNWIILCGLKEWVQSLGDGI